MTEFVKVDGNDPVGESLHYKACGLDDVYLVNGFHRDTLDGEDFLTIENLDGLWKAIAMHLVTKHKVLAPKELRFLREQMDLTQAELAAKLRVSDQTVARWEKGKGDPGPGDVSIRVLYLASPRAQPEGGEILDDIYEVLNHLIDADEQCEQPAVFQHQSNDQWHESERQYAYA